MRWSHSIFPWIRYCKADDCLWHRHKRSERFIFTWPGCPQQRPLQTVTMAAWSYLGVGQDAIWILLWPMWILPQTGHFECKVIDWIMFINCSLTLMNWIKQMFIRVNGCPDASAGAKLKQWCLKLLLNKHTPKHNYRKSLFLFKSSEMMTLCMCLCVCAYVCACMCVSMHAADTLGDEGAWHLVPRGSSNCCAGNQLQVQIKAHEKKNKHTQRRRWVGGSSREMLAHTRETVEQRWRSRSNKGPRNMRTHRNGESGLRLRLQLLRSVCIYTSPAMTSIHFTPSYYILFTHKPQIYIENFL